MERLYRSSESMAVSPGATIASLVAEPVFYSLEFDGW